MYDNYDCDYYDYFEFLGGYSTLTNFNVKDLKLYKIALKRYNKRFPDRNDIFIKDDAYDGYGNLMTDCNALVTTSFELKTEFWRIFDEVRKQNSKGVYNL